jgi:UrcA family protein
MLTFRRFLLLAAACTLALLVSPASSDNGIDTIESDIDEHIYAIGKAAKSDEVSVTVRFGELNLDNEKGVAVLYRRLQRAAEYVCGVEPYWVSRSRTRQAAIAACYSAALSASVYKIDSLALRQMHQNSERTSVLAAKVE